MKSSSSMSAAVAALLLLSGSTRAQFECNTAEPSPSDPSILQLGPTCSEIVADFPSSATSTPPEDLRIMCPFIRMLHRVGDLEPTSNDEDEFWTRITGVSQSAKDFGCAHSACGVVATAVGVGQKLTPTFDFVKHALDMDAFRLWDAPGVSHDCGFGFTLGEQRVNASARAASVQRLQELATPEGHLSYDDLAQVKAEACARDYALHVATGADTLNSVDDDAQTLEVTAAEDIELGLIFGYCGGVDRGYVTVSDVERLFNAQLPENKSKFEITIALLLTL